MKANAHLTPREMEIAQLLAWGAAKKEVSDKLCISTRTVENTARNIYEKIGIQKATELCVWWFCTQCGVSFSLSPIKRSIIATILLFAFFQSNIAGTNKSERYFRSNSRAERIAGRRCREDDANDLDFSFT